MAHHHADRGVGFRPMTTGAGGGAAITALLGHPDHHGLSGQEREQRGEESFWVGGVHVVPGIDPQV